MAVHVTWGHGTGLATIGWWTRILHSPSHPDHLSLQTEMPPNREPMWYCHEVSLSSDLIPLIVLIPEPLVRN